MEPRRDSGSDGLCARQVRHVEAEVDLVEPADVHLVQMPVRLQPRDRLVVRAQVEVGPAAFWPRRPAPQQVMPERKTARALPPGARGRALGSSVQPPSACGSRTLPGAGAPRRPAVSRSPGATATLLASVVSTARRAGTKVRSTGADEGASFSASKLAAARLHLRGPREPCRRAAKRRPMWSAAPRTRSSPPRSDSSSWPAE